jgi:hypothetical protein
LEVDTERYIPNDNDWIHQHITTLMSNALGEAAALERTEDAIQKLEDNTPSRSILRKEREGEEKKRKKCRKS